MVWSLTPAAVERLQGDVIGADAVTVAGHGNAHAATAFLQGLALEELDRTNLTPHDAAYPIVVTARAQRSAVPGRWRGADPRQTCSMITPVRCVTDRPPGPSSTSWCVAGVIRCPPKSGGAG